MKKAKKTRIDQAPALEFEWVIDAQGLETLLTYHPSAQFRSIRLDVLGPDPQLTCSLAYNALKEGGVLYAPKGFQGCFENIQNVANTPYVLIVRQ